MANKEEKIAEKIEQAIADGQRDLVKDLRRQLGEHLAAGAEKCGNCGHDVVGMLKTIAYYDEAKGIDVPPVYEVGCVICPPHYVEAENGVPGKLDGVETTVKRRSYSARATTPEQAVANWNAGKYIEDTRFGVNVRPEEAQRLELMAVPE